MLKNFQIIPAKLFQIWIPLILFIIIFVSAGLARFHGITLQGVSGCDTFGYIKEARLWADQQPPQFLKNMAFYRPVAYLLHSWAIRLGGWNDYSIKSLHGIFDLANILLLFILAYLLSERWWNALIAPLLYAFLPMAVEYARSEIVQTMSIFFVLLSVLFLIIFQKHEPRKEEITVSVRVGQITTDITSIKGFLLWLAGGCLGMGANVHGDIAFLGPGVVAYLFFLEALKKDRWHTRLLQFGLYAFVFTVGFFTPYFIGIAAFSLRIVYRVMSGEISSHTGQITAPAQFFRFVWNAFQAYLGNAWGMFVLFVFIPVFMWLMKVKKQQIPSWAYLPGFLLLFYLGGSLLTASVFPDEYARLLFQMFPLVILLINYWTYTALWQAMGKFGMLCWVTIAVLLFFLHNAAPLWKDYGQERNRSPYRIVYDLLHDKVNADNKLLITPVITYTMHATYPGGFRSDIYFGSENALYEYQLILNEAYTVDSLHRTVSQYSITFIFVSNDILIDERMLSTFFFPHWTNNRDFTYSLKKDQDIISQYIARRNGRLLYDGYWGKLYELSLE